MSDAIVGDNRILINKTIDEIGALQIQMMKEREAHHQQIRSILAEKQRVIFDSRGGKGFHKGSCFQR